jgi:hypothetical protein
MISRLLRKIQKIELDGEIGDFRGFLTGLL